MPARRTALLLLRSSSISGRFNLLGEDLPMLPIRIGLAIRGSGILLVLLNAGCATGDGISRDQRIHMVEIALPARWFSNSEGGPTEVTAGALVFRDLPGGELLFRVRAPDGQWSIGCYAVHPSRPLDGRVATDQQWNAATPIERLESEEATERPGSGAVLDGGALPGGEEVHYQGRSYRRKGELWLEVLISPGRNWIATRSLTQRRGWGG